MNFEIAKSVIERVKNQLKFIGIWPFGLTFLAKIRFSLLVFYHANHLMMGYADLISIFGDIEKTVENFSETNTQSSILIRILLLKLSKDLQILLATTLNHMNEENYRDDDEKRIFIKYYLLADKLLKYGIYFAMGSTIYWYVKGIPAYIDARLHNETAILATPYRLCTFIDITPLHRTLIIYVFELTMIYINNIGIYMLTLYTLIVLNMCVQLAILSHRIKIYFKDDHKNIRKENSFKYYVDKHSQLISMIQKINDIYYFQLFYELLSFTVLLGLLMYTGSESFNNDDIAGAIFIGCYICCMMIIIFCTCYLGECIHTEVDNLRDTYYQCLSYNLSMEDKKKITNLQMILKFQMFFFANDFFQYFYHFLNMMYYHIFL
uniref:Odorant receptor n=1 Tax=Aphidius gifuensis TaxID=684658 RepID=A0A3S9LWA6_APHGI|nr:odorant receptor [Aphidius gifuensis]